MLYIGLLGQMKWSMRKSGISLVMQLAGYEMKIIPGYMLDILKALEGFGSARLEANADGREKWNVFPYYTVASYRCDVSEEKDMSGEEHGLPVSKTCARHLTIASDIKHLKHGQC